jgi:hypothetical protein
VIRPALGAVLAALAAAAPPGWHTYRADGISVRYPLGWFAARRALTPVTAPAQLLAIASYPLPHGNAGADGCAPKAALDRLPPRGAFLDGWDAGTVAVLGRRAARAFPPRPRHFRLGRFARYECMGPSYLLRFRQAGRAFQIHVVLGKRAGPKMRATVLRILDSFRVTRG